MPDRVLSANLVISAEDKTGKTFTNVAKKMESLQRLGRQMEAFERTARMLEKVEAFDRMSQGIDRAVAPLERASAQLERFEKLERMAAQADRFERMASNIESADGALGKMVITTRQATEAERKHYAALRESMKGAAEMAAMGAGIKIGTSVRDSLKLGGNLSQTVAQLKSAGETDAEIAAARERYREYSKTRLGVTEAEYLSTYSDVRMIAPAEKNEMTDLGMNLKLALRNSGVGGDEGEIQRVMRAMDEMGLKTEAQRADFLNNYIKSRQALKNQVDPQTYLASILQMHGARYDLDDDFFYSYLPTLMQSFGKQSGTDIAQLSRNYRGHHMQHAEMVALAKLGLADPKDFIKTKTGDIKGLKPGAHFWGEDIMAKNPVQWAWDLHDKMIASGKTEQQFNDFAAMLPSTMGDLVRFAQTARGNLERDKAQRAKAHGIEDSSNDAMMQNAVATFDAMSGEFNQLLTTVGGPAAEAAIPVMRKVGDAFHSMSMTIEEFSEKYPGAAKSLAVITEIGAALAGLGLTAGGARALIKSISSVGGAAALNTSAMQLDGAAAALTEAAMSLRGGKSLGGEGGGVPEEKGKGGRSPLGPGEPKLNMFSRVWGLLSTIIPEWIFFSTAKEEIDQLFPIAPSDHSRPAEEKRIWRDLSPGGILNQAAITAQSVADFFPSGGSQQTQATPLLATPEGLVIIQQSSAEDNARRQDMEGELARAIERMRRGQEVGRQMDEINKAIQQPYQQTISPALADELKRALSGNARIEIEVKPSPDFITHIVDMVKRAMDGYSISGVGSTGRSMPGLYTRRDE